MKINLIYNFIALILWINVIFYYYSNLNNNVSFNLIKIVQTFNLLDILLAVLKITKNNPFLCFLQLLSRIVVIYYPLSFISNSEALCQKIMFIIWGFADSIRFAYYLFNNYVIKLLRYNAFLILYPVGVFLEIKTFKNADLGNIFYLIILIYLIGFPILFFHMLRSRSKKL